MPVATSRKSRRKNEGGFALLLVFLMASMIAISLYLELPRVAMQTQRDKEETLIDRGEQYKRAIQLFVKKTNHYPAKIEDLESFQNQRFLRKRYVDPMTGKDEWRAIHINNGVLTDSKLTKPPVPGGDDKPKGPNGFVMEMAGLAGAQGQNGGAAVTNAKDRRRASEGGVAATDPNAPPPPPGAMPPGGMPPGGMQGINTAGGMYPNQPPLNGITPSSLNGNNNGTQPNLNNGTMPNLNNGTMPNLSNGTMPGMSNQPYGSLPQGTPGMPGNPGLPGLNGINPMNGQPGSVSNAGNGPVGGNSANSGGSFVGGGNSFVGGGGSFIGGGPVTGSQPSNPGMAGNPYPGTSGTSLPGQPGPAANSQNFGGTPAYPTAAGANGNPPGFPQPGTGTGGNAAADMIRNILTTPRPGGMPTGAMGGQVIGGGIAGFASNGEGEGVKVYNDHSLYQEWEFVFDPAKVKVIPNPNVASSGMGTPASQMPGASAPGQGTLPAGMSPVGGTPPGSIMNNILTPPKGQ
jgi:hypothetical protein